MLFPGNREKPGKFGRYMDFVFQLSLTLAASVLAGVFGGIWLDKTFDKSPLFLLIGVFWGVGGGTWWLVLKVKQFAEESDSEKPSGESS